MAAIISGFSEMAFWTGILDEPAVAFLRSSARV